MLTQVGSPAPASAREGSRADAEKKEGLCACWLLLLREHDCKGGASVQRLKLNVSLTSQQCRYLEPASLSAAEVSLCAGDVHQIRVPDADAVEEFVALRTRAEGVCGVRALFGGMGELFLDEARVQLAQVLNAFIWARGDVAAGSTAQEALTMTMMMWREFIVPYRSGAGGRSQPSRRSIVARSERFLGIAARENARRVCSGGPRASAGGIVGNGMAHVRRSGRGRRSTVLFELRRADVGIACCQVIAAETAAEGECQEAGVVDRRARPAVNILLRGAGSGRGFV